VPPIYQPELIADAAVHAVLHPRREVWIAWSTVEAILGQRALPGLLDHYLAKHAWEAQTTTQLPAGHPHMHELDDVDVPLKGDRGAHGPFDARARRHSSRFWLRTHPGVTGALALVAAGFALRRLTARSS